MKNVLAVMLLPFFLSACAIATEGYTKEGATELQQKRDAYECERDAYTMTRTADRERKRMYRQCMESRGYSLASGKE